MGENCHNPAMTLDQATATLVAYRKEISEETKFFMP